MKSTHTIAVILKNKIGALDTVLPILMDVASRNPSASIEFHTLHTPTYLAIKSNYVLWDAVNSIGIIPDHNKGGWLSAKISKVWMLLRLAVLCLFGRAQIIHFKDLAQWPLRLLYHVSPQRVIYIRDGAYGAPASLQKVMYERKSQHGTHGPGFFKVNAGNSGLQVFFHRDTLKYTGVALDAPFVIMRPPRSLDAWKNFVVARAKTDLDSELAAA